MRAVEQPDPSKPARLERLVYDRDSGYLDKKIRRDQQTDLYDRGRWPRATKRGTVRTTDGLASLLRLRFQKRHTKVTDNQLLRENPVDILSLSVSRFDCVIAHDLACSLTLASVDRVDDSIMIELRRRQLLSRSRTDFLFEHHRPRGHQRHPLKVFVRNRQSDVSRADDQRVVEFKIQRSPARSDCTG